MGVWGLMPVDVYSFYKEPKLKKLNESQSWEKSKPQRKTFITFLLFILIIH